VKNSAAGSTLEADPGYIAESSSRWLASNAIDAWSTIMSTMTNPRIQSIAAMRVERGSASTWGGATGVMGAAATVCMFFYLGRVVGEG
jgi:hypothetical protein